MHGFLTQSGLDAQGQPTIRSGGPRFGLIVSKAVGTAVIRHRVARRLRHICAGVIDDLPDSADIVIRALPGAASASSAELDRQLRSALHKLFPPTPHPDAARPVAESGRSS